VAVASAGPYANHLQLAADSNHASTASIHLFTGQMLFLMPNQHCQALKVIHRNVRGSMLSNVLWKAAVEPAQLCVMCAHTVNQTDCLVSCQVYVNI